MKEVKMFESGQYRIIYSPSLQPYVDDELKHAKKQREKLINLFGGDIGVIKSAMFDNREDFVEHIQNIADGAVPPQHALGCFYAGEIQSLYPINSGLEFRVGNLAHEQTHLFINKYVYNVNHVSRVRWFDESFACYFEERWKQTSKEKLQEKYSYLSQHTDVDLNTFNKCIPPEYMNGTGYAYAMFLFVGEYIFRTGQEKELIDLFKTAPEKVQERGATILKEAVDYFSGEFEK